jgi:hypothetical protein
MNQAPHLAIQLPEAAAGQIAARLTRTSSNVTNTSRTNEGAGPGLSRGSMNTVLLPDRRDRLDRDLDDVRKASATPEGTPTSPHSLPGGVADLEHQRHRPRVDQGAGRGQPGDVIVAWLTLG